MKILLLFLAALLVLTLALTIPIWVVWMLPEDTAVAVISPNPQIIVGLFSFVVAVLSLVGGAVYLLLRDQIHQRVRSEFDEPAQIARSLVYSYMAYLDYSRSWAASNFSYLLQHDPRFQTVVAYASETATQAVNRARAIKERLDPDLWIEAINSLAYHQATQYHLWGNELHKRAALRLAGELEKLESREINILETLAWVKIICNPADRGGRDIVIGLLRRDGLPHFWRDYEREKYTRLFRLDLSDT